MSGRRWRTAVPLIAIGAGVLFGVSASTSSGVDLRPEQTSLAGVVRDAGSRVAQQQQSVKRLRGQVQRLTAAGRDDTAVRSLDRRADRLAPESGMTRVSGSALRVTLTDSTRDVSSLPEGGTADWLVVHQQDVQAVVNALWRGGATSMMLMDQRVISTSAVRCVGNTLILQGRVYSPPFTITAMGDQTRLRKALEADETVQNYRAYVDIAGLGYQQSELDTTFPAYAGALSLDEAKPAR